VEVAVAEERPAPERADALNRSAVMLTEAGRPFEAVEILSRALESEPENPILHFNKGIALQKTGDYEKALGAFQAALAYDEAMAAAWGAMALLYYESSALSRAEDCYKTALRLDGDEPRVWNNYGVLHFTRGDYDAARQCFEKSAAMLPSYRDALINLRDTCRRLEDWRAAAETEALLGALG
jgi:Flp pilus assembly protein TadD